MTESGRGLTNTLIARIQGELNQANEQLRQRDLHIADIQRQLAEAQARAERAEQAAAEAQAEKAEWQGLSRRWETMACGQMAENQSYVDLAAKAIEQYDRHQATITELRGALEELASTDYDGGPLCWCSEDWGAHAHEVGCRRASAALALPADGSALAAVTREQG